MKDNLTIKRALVSVSDKTGLEEIVKTLVENGVEIISSGGTGCYLTERNINWTPIEEVTGNPEAFGGRMKTLSFQVSSALLFRRDNEADIKQAKDLEIKPIDMVICNLYPFVETSKKTRDIDELIEKIDIGGPTMVRAAAKNFKSVLVCVDPKDYPHLISKINHNDTELRKKMALKAFKHTSNYESAIAKVLTEELDEIEDTTIGLELSMGEKLRYGENPHQWAKVVIDEHVDTSLAKVEPLQGKKLSYNNFLDSDAALRCTSDLHNIFENKKIVTIIKHANPCGVAVENEMKLALENAWAGDPISSFGSIICFNQEVSLECAEFLSDKFVEVLIAPKFSVEARSLFAKKRNLRLLELPMIKSFKNDIMIRSINGGWIAQQEDSHIDLEFDVVTENKKIVQSLELLRFGSLVTKHLKSNAIALVRKTDEGFSLAGAGMGNPNRLVSTHQAIEKAKENKINLEECTLVSDAFFPFRDNVDLASEFGIKQIIQPGGSIRDNEVIEACDQSDISMCFTGKRHFRH